MPVQADANIEQAAALLLAAHRGSQPIATAPGGALRGLDLGQAYAVQDRVVAALGGTGGWKVGAPGPEAEPVAAPIPAPWIAASPLEVPAARFLQPGVEAELAFRFARALPARGAAYTPEEVLDAVEALLPAIEITDSRLGAWAGDLPLWKLADNQSNGSLVHGPALREWRTLELARFPVELWIDGHCVVAGRDSANPGGDPLRLLTWLANHLAAARGGLAAGAVVTTGSFTGLVPVRAGQRVQARYPGIGEVAVDFG